MNRINFAQIFADNMSNITKLKKADKYEIIRTQSKIEAIETTDLNTIKGVGQTTIKALLENGIDSVEKIKEVGLDKLKTIGINQISLGAIKRELFN